MLCGHSCSVHSQRCSSQCSAVDLEALESERRERDRTDVRTGADPFLYRRILFAAARFPSKNRANVYAEIRDEFRRNATLAEPEAGEAVALARQSLRQLEAYTTMTRSSGNWEITMEKNPMPKPPSADASSSGGGAAGAS